MGEFERLLDGPLGSRVPADQPSYSEVSTKRIEVIVVPSAPVAPVSPLIAIGWFVLVAVVVAAIT